MINVIENVNNGLDYLAKISKAHGIPLEIAANWGTIYVGFVWSGDLPMREEIEEQMKGFGWGLDVPLLFKYPLSRLAPVNCLLKGGQQ